jgi:hypothetical protein
MWDFLNESVKKDLPEDFGTQHHLFQRYWHKTKLCYVLLGASYYTKIIL